MYIIKQLKNVNNVLNILHIYLYLIIHVSNVSYHNISITQKDNVWHVLMVRISVQWIKDAIMFNVKVIKYFIQLGDLIFYSLLQ